MSVTSAVEEQEAKESGMAVQGLDLRAPVPGALITGAVCVRRRASGVTKAGLPYLTLDLGNRTGAISARIWSEGLSAWEGVEVGSPVAVEGRVKAAYKKFAAPELDISRVVALPMTHPVALELNPVCPETLDQLTARFDAIAASLTRPGQALLDAVLDYVGRRAYFHAVASTKHHHAYVHGLLQHSLEVAEISLGIAAHCAPVADSLDHDALVVGALLHDIGKVDEYTPVWDGAPIDIARDGRLTYHTASGGATVAVATALAWGHLAAAGVHPIHVQHLQHVIASHHMAREYGSVVEPMSPESLIIHVADLVSARTRAMIDDRATVPPTPDGWVTSSGWPTRHTLWLRAALAARAQREYAPAHGGASAGVSPADDMPSAEWPGALPGRVVVRLHVCRAISGTAPVVFPTFPHSEE